MESFALVSLYLTSALEFNETKILGTEFLMIPQNAFQGTAQPVKVTVVKNETAVSMVGVQKFVHVLSYSHQLTCTPTALPEPIYQVRLFFEINF